MAAPAAGLVLLLASSWCRGGAADADLYPGLQFDFNQVDGTSPRVENIEEYYPDLRWPRKYQQQSFEDDPEIKLLAVDELLRLARERQLQDAEAERAALAEQAQTWWRQRLSEYGAMRPSSPNLGQYRRDMELPLAYQHAPHLSKERLHEMFKAAVEDFGQSMRKLGEDQYPKHDVKEFPTGQTEEDSMETMGSMGSMNEEQEYQPKEGEVFPTRFSDVPVVEDPAEFGYVPPDPRFYEKSDDATHNGKSTESPTTSSQKNQSKVANSKIHVMARSDANNVDDGETTEDVVLDNARQQQEEAKEVVMVKTPHESDSTAVYIIAMVAGISAAATVGLIAIGIGWFNLQRHMKNAEESDYPSYGIVGPNKDYDKRDRDETAGDRRLAQSAQMYHYQHQKQQIIAMGRNTQGGHGSVSDTDEEEDEEGNYTVYECPGLASIEGPLEVRNPMFDDDQLATPSQTPSKPADNTTEDKK